MIRTKAKSLLLSIMLVFACSCFFACKETKINVDSVVFQEKSISMLVGDSYSPQIKILPSYATDRSYRLISSDPTALGVDGSTIVALRASVDVKLKVVSNYNENVNDVISVVIYDEPVTLISPTSLSFDGEAFSFVDLNDSSVSSYVLSINGSEINIGNNTKYAFESVVAKLGESLYNTELVCKVKAVGDNKIFIDSEYSEEITFTKYGKVQGARVLDERLYFTPVNNATGYTVKVLKAGNLYQTYNVEEYSAVDGVDLSMLTDSVNGAEYQIQILPKINDGEFNSSPESLNYVVLGKVYNLNISGDMISWDFVKNAQGYDLDLYQNSSLIKQYTNFSHNYLQIPANFVAGEYVFKIRAKSGMANTLQGAYNEISFKILTAPIVTAENNLVSWSSVDDAQGYFITITNNRGATIVSKKFVTNNTYDVSTFEAGDYTICVVANGNGGNVLASANSVPAVWSVLNNATLSVSNKVVSWEDVGATSYDFVCVSNADASEIINTSLSSTSYDLSAVELDAGNYTISVTPRGTGSSFDAKTTTETITKLADATIDGLSNKQFAINKATSGVRYKLEINKVDDYVFAPIALEQMVDGNKFVLDDSVLSAGQYTAKVYVYGNDANIFDADNISAEYEFEKLNTPVIKYDKKTGASGSAVIKIIVESVDGSEKYNLMQNNVSITDGQEYDVSTINAGDYVYTAQAVGNNADKLDSDITAEGVAIKKLSTPTIAFDKTTLQYTINTMDADKPCIENYYFTINGTSVPGVTTTNNVADCSEHMKNATNYTAIAYAVAKSGNKQDLGFDLIIDSESVAYDDVSKLSGLCTFKIEVVADNIANLIVEPVDTSALTGTGYKLNLKIGEIELDAFNCTTKVDEETHEACVENFVMNLYKAETEYEVIEVLNDIMSGSGEYGVSAVISNTNAKIVDSDRYTIPTTFKVLGKVDNIEKNGQVIEFNVVENATDYIAIVNLSGVETYIKLNNQYNVKAGDTTKNQLAIDTLIELLGESKYRVETVYSIKFVALSNDSSTLANKGTTSYSFKFLKSPDIDIVEQEGSSIKYLSIQNRKSRR